MVGHRAWPSGGCRGIGRAISSRGPTTARRSVPWWNVPPCSPCCPGWRAPGPNRHAKASHHVLHRITAPKRLSLTDDQGRERTDPRRRTEATGVKVYFADPHSSWQRGINKNTHGLSRGRAAQGEWPERLPPGNAGCDRLETGRPVAHVARLSEPAELCTPEVFNVRQHHAARFAQGP